METKFKCWHKPSKRFLILTGISFHTDEVVVEITGINTIMPMDEVELLPFIGRKDKDGSEIHTGDIVKMHQFLFDGTEVEEEHTGVVSYNPESASFNFTKIKGEFYSKHTGYPEGEDVEGTPICNFYGLHDESFEIIGNIYENPDLLK